jgi:hypothetical protein
MRSRHLDQLSRFREAEIIGFLLDSPAQHCHRAGIHYPYTKSSREGVIGPFGRRPPPCTPPQQAEIYSPSKRQFWKLPVW